MNSYSFSQLTESGGRSCNEDYLLVCQKGGALISVIADGLGGLGGGDIASSTAASATIDYLQGIQKCTEQDIINAIDTAGTAVIAKQNNLTEMKTTIALLYAEDGKAICGHLGDSRIYQFRKDDILFQTRDHSVSQMAVSVGEIMPDKIRFHADRNKLLRALGTREKMPAEINELSINCGDGLLLCTDGFWELISEDEMIRDFEKSKTADQWLEEMRRKVESRLNDKSDNYSAIAVMIN